MMYDGHGVAPTAEEQISQGAVVFCKDCKHYLKTFSMWMGQTEARCLRTHESTVDLVTGKVSKVDYYQLERCRRMRENGIGTCGKNGKFWTPRKETPEMTMLLLKRKV